jgi:nucleoside 2-deoxyribosyltransferase
VKKIKSIYVIGALKNWKVVKLTNELEKMGYEAFSEWLTPGPEADSYLLKYAKMRGWDYARALKSYAAEMIFNFDLRHINRCDAAVMLAPTGKSGHLELGYVIGKGKPGFILFEKEPKRFDVMLQFATEIFFSKKEFFTYLKGDKKCR